MAELRRPTEDWGDWRVLQSKLPADSPAGTCPACGERVLQAVAVMHIQQEHSAVDTTMRVALMDAEDGVDDRETIF